MPLAIRTAKRGDMFSVLKLIKEGSGPDNPTWPQELGAADASKAISNVESAVDAGLVDVATKDGVIVGIVIAAHDEHLWGKKKFLVSQFAYLTPSARHGGDGLVIFEIMRLMAARVGLPFVSMIHEHDRTKAHAACFEKFGFEKYATVYILPMEKNDVRSVR